MLPKVQENIHTHTQIEVNRFSGTKQSSYKAYATNILHFSVIRNAMRLSLTERRGFNDLQYTVIRDAHILIWDAGTIHSYIIKGHAVIVIYIYVRSILQKKGISDSHKLKTVLVLNTCRSLKFSAGYDYIVLISKSHKR